MDRTDAVPGYELFERIAAAGDVSVHEARELASARSCLLSVLRSDEPPTAEQEERQVRFLEEGRHLLGFNHPNVLRTYDVGSAPGRVWLAQERVSGLSLQDALEARGGPLELASVLAVGVQVGRALSAMAEVELIHRDVCAENVLIGQGGRALLGGFGLNFESSYDRLSMGRAPLGSVSSLSPEQVEGDLPLDPRTDVYGLGATLYRCLAGRVPHGGASLFTRLRAIAHEAPPDLREVAPAVPDLLAELIARFMEWDPDDRPLPQDVAGLLEDAAARLGLAEEGWETRALLELLARARAETDPGRPPEARPILIRLRGTDRTIERTLALGDGFEVGRVQDAAVTLRFGWISRRHARIERRREGVFLIDLGSANGTTHNGERIEGTRLLATGDLIAFGKSRFEVAVVEGEAAVPATMHCQLCGQELTGDDLEEGDTVAVCVRCQAGAEAHREAADHRIRRALEERRFEVVAPIGGPGLLRRYRVRRGATAFLASAIELGQRTARLFADASKPALSLGHPHVLRTIDVEVRAGVLVVLAEDHPGPTLEELVAARGPLAPRDAALLGEALCAVAEYVLGRGVPHALLRPDLVLIAPDDAPKVLDLGLAPGLAEVAWTRGGVGPRPCYEAPEADDLRRLTPAAVVYSLGATLSFALTGNPVAEVRGGERYDHLPLTMVSSVPSALATALSRATAPDPADRPPTPRALRDLLRSLVLESGVEGDDLLDESEMTRPLDPGELPPEVLFD